jgi:hypothetical protein
MEVFAVEDPERRDLLSIGSWAQLRRELRVWDVAASDVHGCWRLSNSRLSVPSTTLLGPGFEGNTDV